MRNVILTALVSMTAATAPQLMANSVNVDWSAWSTPVAGEFNTLTSPGNFVQYYSPAAEYGSMTGAFPTFCIETTVDFNPGDPYYYSLSQTDSQGRSLSLGAAYLYYLFATGNLNYAYYNNSPGRVADAFQLQAALWYLQGGQSYGGYPNVLLGTDPYFNLATGPFGSVAGAMAPSGGAYGVYILDLWSNPNDTGPDRTNWSTFRTADQVY